MWVPHSQFNGQQTALREPEDKSLFGRKTGLALSIEKRAQQPVASPNARPGIIRKIVPGKSSVIGLGRIHQEKIQPRKTQHLRQPAVTFDTVAQPVQRYHQPTRVSLVRWDKIRL